ncbi:hypothetical protein Tco_0537869 [Tanacetum coccineum]
MPIFPYLNKGVICVYDIWAMKMQNYITNLDLLCWNIVLNGTSHKKIQKIQWKHHDLALLYPAEEHLDVPKGNKTKTTLLTSYSDDPLRRYSSIG